MSRATKGEQRALEDVSQIAAVPILSNPLTSNIGCVLKVHVDGVPANCLVDTGAVATILSKEVWDRREGEQKPLVERNPSSSLVGVQGTPLELVGSGDVNLRLGQYTYLTRVLVAKSLTTDLILGRDFLTQHKCTVELGEKSLLRLTKEGVALSLGSKEAQPEIASVAVAVGETLCIPPLSEMEIMAKVPKMEATAVQAWLVEPRLAGKRSAVAVARAVVTPCGEYVPLRILNPRNEPVSLQKGDELADMEPLPVQRQWQLQWSRSEQK